MATSGNFTTNKYKNLSMMFSWSVKSQSIENNNSTIEWSLEGYRTDGATGMITCGNFTVTINGETVYSTGRYDRVNIYNGTVVTTGEITIPHNDDGSKTFDVYVAAAIYEGTVTSTGTAQFELPPIPRKSGLTVSNGTLGTPQTLEVTRKSSSFTHTITYVCGSASGTICEKSSNTSISWTPPLDLASQNTTGTTVTVVLTITTYNGNTVVGSDTKTISCTIPASVAPLCSVAVSDDTGNATKYGGYIKGVSKLKVVISATPSYGADITSYRTTADGAVYPDSSFITDVLRTAGNQNVVATVTDKRGRSGSDTETITVLDYSAPAITSLSVHRCNANGTETDQGEYVKVTFSGRVTALNNKNTARYTVGYKKSTVSGYTSEVLTAYNNNYSVTGASFVFKAETGSSYDVRVTVEDAFRNVPATTSASTAFTLMHWKADGTAMGIGKVAEKPYTLDMGIDIELNDKDIYRNGAKAFAPAGYGLGGTAPSYDVKSETEFYSALADMLNKLTDASVGHFAVSDNYAAVFGGGTYIGTMYKVNNSYASAEFISYGAYAVSKAAISCYGGVWQELEWENPHMRLGVEYRTTERWQGKVVYTKAFNTGALTNGGSLVYTDEKVTPIRSEATCNGNLLPYYAGGALLGGVWSIWYDITENYFTGYFGTGMTACEYAAQIWYTKH